VSETTTTAVIESVTSKEGAKDGKPWRKFTVKTEDGTFYSTFKKEVAEAAHALEGQRAEITWKPSGNENQFKDITAAKAATNGGTAEGIPTEKTASGDVDWDLIGLRKTRCLLWANYLQSSLAVAAANKGGAAPAQTVYQFGVELIRFAERDIFWREPATEDADIPFGDD
jgi:hypothetical protein